MAITIDYYFAGSSPFTYLGHQAIRHVAAKHGARLSYKPVSPMGVWKQSGSVPLPQRTPVRQRYRFLELQRIAEMRDLPINLQPAYFPADSTLADCCVIAIQQAGGDPADYMAKIFEGVWIDQANIADGTEISARLEQTGFDPSTILAAAKTDTIQEIRNQYTIEASSNDAVGVPAFVLNGEVFWGQDRIEFIDLALSSGRQPYRPANL